MTDDFTKGEMMKRLAKMWNNANFHNSLWSLLGKAIAMCFYLILDIAIARILKIKGYSEWVYFFSIVTMFYYIGWFGINTSIKVIVSKKRREDVYDCLYAGFILRLIISVLVASALYSSAAEIAGFFGYPEKYANMLQLVKISSLMVFMNSCTEFCKEICVGISAYKELFFITVFEYLGYFIFSIIFLSVNLNPASVAIGYIVSGIVTIIAGGALIKKATGFKCSLVTKHYRKNLLPILKYALPMTLISMGGLILVEMDVIMLGMYSSKEQVSIYSIAKQICTKATHINYAIILGTMTSFSILNAQNVIAKYKEFKKINLVNIAIIFCIFIVFVLVIPALIPFFYGLEYAAAGNVIRILACYYVLYGISNFYAAFLDFQNRAKFRSICYLSIIIINLALNFLLIPKWGANGAAVATTISLLPYSILVVKESYGIWRTKLQNVKNDASEFSL